MTVFCKCGTGNGHQDGECWKCGEKLSSASPTCSAPLSGRWRHGGGYLICGTLRIARADFDTNPSPELQAELMDWIVSALNEAQNGQREQRGHDIKSGLTAKYIDGEVWLCRG